MGSHSCRFICPFSLVSRSLSPFSHLRFLFLRSLYPTLSVAFLLQSSVSLLCPAPGLLPQFSVKLEFEITLLYLFWPLTLYCIAPSFLLLHVSSLSLQLTFCITSLLHSCVICFSIWLCLSISPILYFLFLPSLLLFLTLCFISHSFSVITLYTHAFSQENKLMHCWIKLPPFFTKQPPPTIVCIYLFHPTVHSYKLNFNEKCKHCDHAESEYCFSLSGLSFPLIHLLIIYVFSSSLFSHLSLLLLILTLHISHIFTFMSSLWVGTGYGK